MQGWYLSSKNNHLGGEMIEDINWGHQEVLIDVNKIPVSKLGDPIGLAEVHFVGYRIQECGVENIRQENNKIVGDLVGMKYYTNGSDPVELVMEALDFIPNPAYKEIAGQVSHYQERYWARM
jgi:hypothetical protein